ncbi:ABC transporter permease [Phycicoccus sp. BSK3Z-2]|uniref:ABC transporter permease n=1 Tax=Phycicoccus avicenniae TaxID=2828860 RepID=A0A941I247_9MICO|nr:ABC transporter permease [Phycicoccus avicenniae]MBR7744664.1 ABC transporter permease [Phycicoccus avicenniae]
MNSILEWFGYVAERYDDILETTWEHAQLVLVVIGVATTVAVLLGVYVQRRPTLRAMSLSITGIFLTIPSLAFFAFFIPVFGIGNRPAIVAMILYALLPILRNTVTGLDAVPPAVVESAKGMGMGTMRQLFQIKLPLAWPIMMAGVRIASLITVGIAAIAVLVGGDGLGSYIQSGLTRLGLPNSEFSVWTGVVFTVLLGLVLDAMWATIQRFTTTKGQRI